MHYFVGDIHGCYRELLLLEAKIRHHAERAGAEPFVVSVGDLVDRGPRSSDVVRHFRRGCEAGTHAGHLETSVVLAIDPDIVEMDKAVCGKTDLGYDTGEKLHEVGMHNLSPTGILGDPTKSTAEAGGDYIEAISKAMADQIRGTLKELAG